MIPIICSINNHYKSFYETFFIHSYNKYVRKDIYKISPAILADHPNDRYGFGTKFYFFARKLHLEHIKTFLTNFEINKYIISMDSDIIFLPNYNSYVERILHDYKNINIVLSTDYDRIINPGFMILKNCPETLDFIDLLLNTIIRYDESNLPCRNLYPYLMSEINNKNYKIQLLNTNIVLNNNQLLSDNSMLSKQAICFHATSTANIYQKMAVLSKKMFFLEKHGF
jgi:hypothetical protein